MDASSAPSCVVPVRSLRPVAVGGARSEARAAAHSATAVSHARWIATLRAFVSCVCDVRVHCRFCGGGCGGRSVAQVVVFVRQIPIGLVVLLYAGFLVFKVHPSSSWTRGWLPWHSNVECMAVKLYYVAYHYATLRCSSAFRHVFLVLVVNVVIT